MAYIRSVATRSSLVSRRYRASFSYILRDDDQRRNSVMDEGATQRQGISSYIQHRSFGTGFNTSAGPSAVFRGGICSHWSFSPSAGASLLQYMSTTASTDKIGVADVLADRADILSDTAVQTVVNQAPAANEVAIAAADSFFPIAALQHFIDAVHSVTGLNWWAAIAVTTVLIRGAMVPLSINQLKATAKLTIVRPLLEEIKQKVQDRGMDPVAVAEGQKEMQKLFKEHGVSPFTPLKGLLIQGPVFICFFLAISNMVEKVPSFKMGGAFWFIDLTTPDSLYILPVLTGLSFLLNVEYNMQEGLEGNPVAGTMKNVSRVFAFASVPLTMNFPKALFCYWVASNLFSLTYGLLIRVPRVKKILGVPEIPVTPQTAAPQPAGTQPAVNLFSALKQGTAVRQEPTLPSPVEPPELGNQKISSSSVTSQRLRSLEKQVKGRKKNKKR